jgi:hypothetical protein
MARFWVYVGDKVQGPVDIPSLRKVPGFNLLSQVCLEGEQTWRMADEVIEIKSYFLSPPRPNSFAIEAGNTAPKLDLAPPPQILPEEMTLPEPNMSWQKGTLEVIPADEPKKDAAGPASLRTLCEVCGYKNPRDVNICMKCGEKLATTGLDPTSKGPTTTPTKEPVSLPPPPAKEVEAKSQAPASVPPVAEPVPNSMVEISMSKLVAGTAAAAVLLGGGFFGVRSWKKHHVHKEALPAVGVPAPSASHVLKTPYRRSTHGVGKHGTARHNSSYDASRLPGVTKAPAHAVPDQSLGTTKSEEASYHVVSEATPLQQRHSAPMNSPYTIKRRANQALWSSQEGQAIQQVQRERIYGGLRTVGRNVEILMQILRDREYNTAFESGKRIYLYNDLDWSAVLKEGPVYEVHLTFSGGREADGSPKKPLHFAFAADLERGTVEGGGEDQIRSNTLHAFFDESRIPPEDRRAIAKDTEELVLAAQPGASPLALDTVVRQFAKVYTTAALSRVANAYDLTLIKKKLAHDPRLGSEESVDAAMPVEQASKPSVQDTGSRLNSEGGQQPFSVTSVSSPKPAEPKPTMPFTYSGPAVDFRMERGAGHERTILVRATSKASIDRVWEIITGYDRLKQFMPDMLASEREGQDGAAVIVHLVCLTRYMVFMFKVNLHLRVIERPREHVVEFERIAGEFESFRGSVELTTDPATHNTQIAFHATVVPTSHAVTLETMARRLLVPQMEAIRTRAES